MLGGELRFTPHIVARERCGWEIEVTSIWTGCVSQ